MATTDTPGFLAQPLWRLTAICAAPVLILPLMDYLAVAHYGTGFFLWVKLLVVPPVLGAIGAVLVAPLMLLVPRLRFTALRALIASVVLIPACVGGFVLGAQIRTAAFHDLAARSAPLIEAVRKYEAKHGALPADLNRLVPEFLPEVPSTGMRAYPQYEYLTGADAVRFDHNPWVLVVNTPSGDISFDMFLYFPKQNYPQKGYGGGLERIADWAYVHE